MVLYSIFHKDVSILKSQVWKILSVLSEGCSLHFWPGRDLNERDLGAALLLFFTGADLAETKEPVEETTDLASFLLNLELMPETSEEVLEETLPTEEKDLEVERSSSLPVAKPTTLTCSSILRPT